MRNSTVQSLPCPFKGRTIWCFLNIFGSLTFGKLTFGGLSWHLFDASTMRNDTQIKGNKLAAVLGKAEICQFIKFCNNRVSHFCTCCISKVIA